MSAGGYFAYWHVQLIDRHLTLSKTPGIYGTVFGCYYDAAGDFRFLETEVQEPDNLNLRRARVGLEAAEAQRKRNAAEAAAPYQLRK